MFYLRTGDCNMTGFKVYLLDYETQKYINSGAGLRSIYFFFNAFLSQLKKNHVYSHLVKVASHVGFPMNYLYQIFLFIS